MQWWYSQDEERWNGPCETREEAISEGRGEYDDEGFMVMEAEQGDYDLSISAERIFDFLADRNEELTDPDDGAVFSDAKPEQKRDLEKAMAATIKAWADAHKLSYRAFMFTKQRAAESIPALASETTET